MCIGVFADAMPVSLAPRRPEVNAVLQRHSAILAETCSLVVSQSAPVLLGTLFSVPARKVPWDGSTVRETTLVDSTLSMVDHVIAAIRLSFPQLDQSPGQVLEAVVARIVCLGNALEHERRNVMRALQTASRMVHCVTVELRELVPEFARPINGHVNFGLIEVVLRVIEWPDSCLIDRLIFGFCPVGDVPFAGCHRPVDEPERAAFSRGDNQASFDKAAEVLGRKARKHGSDQDEADRCEVWRVTLAECDKDFCVGPLTRKQVKDLFEDSPHGPRCIPAFGIWQKGKLRRIDDACRSLHNALTRMCETIVCCSADLPSRIAAEFAKYVSIESLSLRLGTDDIASAYRILPSSMPEYTVTAVWKPGSLCDGGRGHVAYFALRGFNFGLKSAPLHLASLMKPLVHAARVLLTVACADFYDDVVTVDVLSGRVSSQRTLGLFFQLCGYPFAPKKHERLRFSNAFLGVVTDFTTVALGYAIMRVKEKRRRRLIDELRQVLASQKLSPAHAARLRGKLYFTTTSAFGGVGRAALQAFTERQYSKSKRVHLASPPAIRVFSVCPRRPHGDAAAAQSTSRNPAEACRTPNSTTRR